MTGIGPADAAASFEPLRPKLLRVAYRIGDREVHGDLVVFKPHDQAKAWYELAAEEALPASLREVKGAVDVKMLLQALLVEIGDVKRTNAILMEHMTRLEEKVDRTNRFLRERKQP